MNSFEANKIAGAVLGAIFVVFGGSLLAEGIFHPEAPEEPGYAIAVAEDGAGGEGSGEGAGPAEVPIAALLQNASAENGEAIFRRCAACHTIEEGGPNKVGPNLYSVVMRPVASHEGFSYSAAMEEFSQGGEVHWTYEHLNGFLTDPQAYVPGTAMGFAGLSDGQERADVIAYLRSVAADPAPLPEPPAETADAGAAAEGGEAAPAEGGEATESVAALIAAADPEAGASVFRRCQACHSGEEGGPNKIGPHLWGVVERPVASVADFNYSPAMVEFSQGGEVHWTYEHLDAFLTDPQAYVEGTIMTFPGLADAEERHNLIAYLRTLSNEPAPLPEAGAAAEGAAPAEGQTAAGEAAPAPAEDQAPAEGAAPVQESAPAETTAPAQGEAPVAEEPAPTEGAAVPIEDSPAPEESVDEQITSPGVTTQPVPGGGTPQVPQANDPNTEVPGGMSADSPPAPQSDAGAEAGGTSQGAGAQQ